MVLSFVGVYKNFYRIVRKKDSAVNSYKMELRHSSFRFKLTFLKSVDVEIRPRANVKNLDPSS